MDDGRARVRWCVAWIVFAVVLGLHVADEALTGFLPLYNSFVDSLRARHPWVPLPTFAFSAWIGGLTVLVVILLGLAPLTLKGGRGLRVTSWVLAAIMIANAAGHVAASLWLGRPAPGVVSSPLLAAASVALVVTAAKARGEERGGRASAGPR